MFNEGDKVYVEKSDVVGTVVYIEDDLVYIETAAGAEFEFHPSDLMSYEQYEEERKKKTQPQGIDTPTEEELAKYEKIEACLGDLMKPAKAYQEEMSIMVKAIGGSAGAWDDLSAYQRLNFLSTLIGIRTPQMLEFYPKHLDKLRILVGMTLSNKLEKANGSD